MDILQLLASNVPSIERVNYSCVLTNKWSGATHPVDYASISGSAHWTAPVLVSHSNNYQVWAPGTLASPGVEAVAEGGDTSVLEQEVFLKQVKGKAGELVIGRDQFNSIDPPQVFESISLSPNYPLLSTISMAGPSPDWFTGFYDFSPIDSEGFWYRSFELATYPWDAGTEQGETYSINNDPESPLKPIFQLTRDTVPDSGILLDPTGTEVLPVAVWNCVLDTRPSVRSLLKVESPSDAPTDNNRNLLKSLDSPSEAPTDSGRNLLKVTNPSEAPTDDRRNLLKVTDPSEAPSDSGRTLLKVTNPSEAPTDDRRNLLKVTDPSEAPSDSGRTLLKVTNPSEAPTDDRRNLLKVTDPSEAPSDSGRTLLKVANPSEAPTDDSRNLLKVTNPSEAPSDSGRTLLKVTNPSEAPTDDSRNLLKVTNPSEAPSDSGRTLLKAVDNPSEAPTDDSRNLLKVTNPSEAPSDGGRALLKTVDNPSEAPSDQVRGLRGTRD